MSVDVACEVVIARPRAEVAAFMFEPRNDAIWTTGVIEVRAITDGLLRTGSQVERISKFLGRRFGYLVDVVDHQDDTFVEMRVEKPFPMRIRYQLDDCPEGTRAQIRTTGEPRGFFRVAAPLMTRMVRRSIDNDLANLREYLEGGASH